MTGWRKRQTVEHQHIVEQIAEEYNEEFDAYYNPVTNEWIDSKCSDPTCEYCSERPEKPLP